MSIIGEKFEAYVQEQIRIRQFLQGQSNRSNSDIEILSNQNCWIKLVSSVEVVDPPSYDDIIKLEGYEDFTLEQYDILVNSYGRPKLKAIGLTDTDQFMGTQLAKKSVLFNTLSEVNPTQYNEDNSVNKKGDYNQRSGVLNRKSSIWNNDFAYGLGGTTFGIVPPPGIIDASVQCLNRGSIREATVNIKAQNKFQFELIELLYLRLGYSILLEWGWDKYYDNNGKIRTTGNTVAEDHWFQWGDKNTFYEVLKTIDTYRAKYKGNYDGFLGKVVNFDWTLNNDATYDISLKLITVGDVIESLTVNLPMNIKAVTEIAQAKNKNATKNVKLGSKSILVNKASTNTLASNLYLDTVTNINKWNGKQTLDDVAEINEWNKKVFGRFSTTIEPREGNFLAFYDLYLQKTASKTNLLSSNQSSYFDSSTAAGEVFAEQIDNQNFDYDDVFEANTKELGINPGQYNYFLTFGQLMTKLKLLTFPKINDKTVLDIDIGEDNICPAYPYQISFDPKVCLIKPAFPEENTFATAAAMTKSNGTGIYTGEIWMDKMKDFAINDNGASYGRIMNIYLNYEFISSCLADTTDDKGVVKLFRFLKRICDGVNGALGGLNNLEPIVTKDYKITIIDQNPIAGIARSSEYGDKFSSDTVKFEIFGYNPNDKEELKVPTSNFVRDFKFNTTIGPDLASMITIGATAEGVPTKNYDGTGFSNWNKGLRDRFQIKLDPPPESDVNQGEIANTNEAYPLTSDELLAIVEAFESAEYDKYYGVDVIDEWASPVFGWLMERPEVKETNFGHTGEGYRDIGQCPVSRKTYNNTDWKEYSMAVKDWKTDQIFKNLPEPKKYAGQYINYLIQAFGGKVDGAYINDFTGPYYYYLKPEFIELGKQLFKAFQNQINNIYFKKTGKPSNTAGFIPVGLTIDCDGLSGIKIYNGIDIRQEFLPPAYPNALNFIIKQVNHTIGDNDWTTNLETISTANTKNNNIDDLGIGNFDFSKYESEFIEKTVYKGAEVNKVTVTGDSLGKISTVNDNTKTGLIYYPEVQAEKLFIVLHHTAGVMDARGEIERNWNSSPFPLSTTNVINRDGLDVQVYDDRFWSKHLGTIDSKDKRWLYQKRHSVITPNPSGDLFNKKSLSVEIVSKGWDYDDSMIEKGEVSQVHMIDSTGNVRPTNSYRGYKYFQNYNLAQLQSLYNLLVKWELATGINWRITRHTFKEVFPPTGELSINAYNKVKGLYTHNSFRTGKIDIMPQREILLMLLTGQKPTSVKPVFKIEETPDMR